MQRGECCPTVRGEIKKARNSGYDVQSSIFEFIDNACDTGAKKIKIDVREKIENGHKKLNKIIISDDHTDGIFHSHLMKIFSWTYERDRSFHDIGEYGTGFKCASVNLGNTLHILTFDEKNQKYWQAIADWEDMEENNRWDPKILEITEEFYRDYHPFMNGTSFIIENIRHEFFQNQKIPHLLVEKLYWDISYHYKYFLKHFPEKEIWIKGLFAEGKNEKILSASFPDEFFFFSHNANIIESKVLVYKDQANFFNFFIHRKNNPKIEIVEFVEKRKNGNSNLKCAEISTRILASMTLVDELIFKSYSYGKENEDEIILSFGSVDIVQNHRIVGKDVNFRKPRHDSLASYIKHEIIFSSKKLNSIMGIQFNKKSNLLDNDLYYSLEYLQTYHEREIIRLFNNIPKVMEEIPKMICEPACEQVCEKKEIIEKANKRKNFTLETKLQIIKKQECRDSDFDFLLKDEILPLDYDHKIDRTNNSQENCQALSVISHALKTRHPKIYEKILHEKETFIIQLLNCLTSSKYFLKMYRNQHIKILLPEEASLSSGIFEFV